jgi:hypothetical protein
MPAKEQCVDLYGLWLPLLLGRAAQWLLVLVFYGCLLAPSNLERNLQQTQAPEESGDIRSEQVWSILKCLFFAEVSFFLHERLQTRHLLEIKWFGWSCDLFKSSFAAFFFELLADSHIGASQSLGATNIFFAFPMNIDTVWIDWCEQNACHNAMQMICMVCKHGFWDLLMKGRWMKMVIPQKRRDIICMAGFRFLFR